MSGRRHLDGVPISARMACYGEDAARAPITLRGVDRVVLDYIERHPGSTWREVMVAKGFQPGTVTASLKRLVKGAALSVTDGRYTVVG